MHLQKLLTFFQKNTWELDIVFTRTVNILTTNELVKLTMLSTTEPRPAAPLGNLTLDLVGEIVSDDILNAFVVLFFGYHFSSETPKIYF